MKDLSNQIKEAIALKEEFKMLERIKSKFFREGLNQKEIDLILDLYNINLREHDKHTAKYATIYKVHHIYKEKYLRIK